MCRRQGASDVLSARRQWRREKKLWAEREEAITWKREGDGAVLTMSPEGSWEVGKQAQARKGSVFTDKCDPGHLGLPPD